MKDRKTLGDTEHLWFG